MVYSSISGQTGSGGAAFNGICQDVTNAFSGTVGWSQSYTNGAFSQGIGTFSLPSPLGFHFFSACESSPNAVTQQFSGAGGNRSVLQYSGKF